MKKVISTFLSLSIFFSLFISAANAADVTEIDDALADTSKMTSFSDNLIFETRDSLGSYQNPEYVTSNASDTIQIIYELENLANFEVVTLNYRNTENITFSVSDEIDGEYSEISDYSKDTVDLGSSWTQNTYSSDVEEGMKYFQITIEQERSKYIRLDNVRLLADFDVELIDYSFYDENGEIEGDDIFAAVGLQLEFNQRITTIPDLVVSAKNGESINVSGTAADTQGDVILYEFEPLGFDVYTFEAEGITTILGKTYDFSQTLGYEAVSDIPENIHFGDIYTADGFITDIKDSAGTSYGKPDYVLTIDDEEIVSISDDNQLLLNKAGETYIRAEFEFNGQTITISKKIVLCDAKDLSVVPENITLEVNETAELVINVLLTDDTLAVPENVSIKSSDETVVSVSANTLTAVGEGNAFINISVDYYGKNLSKDISVGVGKEPLEALAEVELKANRTQLYVGESIYAVADGHYKDGSEVDLFAAQKNFYSDNESVASVSDDGEITAIAEGTADIYAIYNLGGVSVRSQTLTITVSPDTVDRADLIIPALYIYSGNTITLNSKAYSKTGAAMEDVTVEYHTSNSSVASVAENELTGVAEGTAEVYAVVSDDTGSVETKRYTINVKANNGSFDKRFDVGGNWDNTFDHSSGLYISDEAGILTNGSDIKNQHVTFELQQDANSINIIGTSLGDKHDDDMRIYVSSDNEEYTRIPEDELELLFPDIGEGWYQINYTYSGPMLEGARYIKIVLDRQSGNTQATRLQQFHATFNTTPEVIGYTLLTADGIPAKTQNARSIAVSFSQAMDLDSFAGVSLTANGENVNFTGSYESGIYTLTFSESQNVEYRLTITGAGNQYGTVMDDYEVIIEPSKDDIVISNQSLSNGQVSAAIENNSGETINACVISAVYDADGIMIGIDINENVDILTGDNSYTSDAVFGSDGSSARVYVWSDMLTPYAY